MAIIASNGCFGVEEAVDPDGSVVGDDNRSVALIPSPEELA